MKRKLGFLVSLLGLFLLVFGVIKVISGRSPKQGVLKVQSSPTVSIFLDNKHLGRSPYEGKIDAREYTVKLVPDSTLSEGASWQSTIRISPNLLTYINANLSDSEFTTAVDVLWLEKVTNKQAELAVATNPDGATVMMDDVTKGVTPLALSSVTPNEHTLTVTSPGFLSRTLKIKATPGYKLNASIKLALAGETIAQASPSPAPSPTGAVKGISSKPTSTSTKSATSSGTAVIDPPKPFVVIKDTPTGFLRVREEPSTSATEAARVKPGEKYTILDTQNGWYQIKYDSTNKGWISGQYAEKVE